jgi:hypothetical protein
MEIAALETRVEKEVCFLRTHAVVTTLFCGGEENFTLCRTKISFNAGIVLVSY